MRSADPLLRPWFDRLIDDLGPLEIFDAHTHIGFNDPDGFKQSAPALLERLDAAQARAAVFPMHEPEGYADANDAVIAAAAEAPDRLVPYCRVDPHRGAAEEARRAFAAGARGIKLHPRAEAFALSAPAVQELLALADERRAPVLIHAGRGIPALGSDTVRLAEAYPGARLILAHAAISDLAWIWRVLPDHPNVFVDTSWWNASDLLALFALVPPGQILFASDAPYGSVVQGAVVTLRCGLQAGLTPEQLRGVAGGQLARIVAGEDPADLGPAPGPPSRPADVLLARVADNLVSALARRVVGDDGDEPVALARLACSVGVEAEQSAVCASVLELIERMESHRSIPENERHTFSDLHVLACALTVARTPDVALPVLPAAPAPERDLA